MRVRPDWFTVASVGMWGAAWSALRLDSIGMGKGTILGIEEGGKEVVVFPVNHGIASPLVADGTSHKHHYGVVGGALYWPSRADGGSFMDERGDLGGDEESYDLVSTWLN